LSKNEAGEYLSAISTRQETESAAAKRREMEAAGNAD
jgi:hypothetical protein